MTSERVQELDLPLWVASAPANQKSFREAVHIVLTAISTSTDLRSRMVMKGGLLMAIRYDSTRFTRDADFSTREKYEKGNQDALLAELDAQLDLANDQLPYDTKCLRQSTKLDPKRPDASFPTLTIGIGYASRINTAQFKRLQAKQSSTIVQIDYSYDEAVYDVEFLSLHDGIGLQAYGFSNLLAEKYRALLQQPKRNRNRRQDVYDLYMLITTCAPTSLNEQKQLLKHLVNSCSARDIEAKPDSIRNPQVKQMAAREYDGLAAEIEGELPDFEIAYATVQDFYEKLPW